jgi:tyrosyl-tRNA synthetase
MSSVLHRYAKITTVTDIIDQLHRRGLIAQSTDEVALKAELASGPLTVYCGFDPTAPSLHLGNLVQLLTVRRLQEAGHRPIGLVGGATGLIGDPGGKLAERQLNPRDIVAGWVERIRPQVERFLEVTGPNATQLVNNLDWIGKLDTIGFLRDIGKHVSVNQMLRRDAVASRLAGQGLSYTEFSYMILQAMDYLELHRRYGCRLQTGGSDQWGNIVAGVDLVRRVTGQTVHALTTPLLTKADGSKFGKTATGTIWLDPDLTSPYIFYQHLINTDDEDISRYLYVFSFSSVAEIEELATAHAEHPVARQAQRALARELTSLVHGLPLAVAVEQASSVLFGGGDVRELSAQTLEMIASELSVVCPVASREEMPTLSALMVSAGLCSSTSEARRCIKDGGAYLNNQRVSTVQSTVLEGDLLHRKWIVLRKGKRSMMLVEIRIHDRSIG